MLNREQSEQDVQSQVRQNGFVSRLIKKKKKDTRKANLELNFF